MKRDNFIAFLPYYLLIALLFIGLTMGWNSLVTVLAGRQIIHREHSVIIDAGHGGVDGGATSCTGVLESQINLEIAIRLRDLMHLLGYKTVMIRTTDISVYTKGETIAAKKVSDLKERVRIVNDTDGGILVSIHQNTFSDSRYDGAQVFYKNTNNSRHLAELLQKTFITTLNPGSNRQAKKGDGIYLLEHIERPGVLIECGFLSNPAEEAKLRSEDYQKQLCCVITGVIAQQINA